MQLVKHGPHILTGFVSSSTKYLLILSKCRRLISHIASRLLHHSQYTFMPYHPRRGAGTPGSCPRPGVGWNTRSDQRSCRAASTGTGCGCGRLGPVRYIHSQRSSICQPSSLVLLWLFLYFCWFLNCFVYSLQYRSSRKRPCFLRSFLHTSK